MIRVPTQIGFRQIKMPRQLPAIHSSLAMAGDKRPSIFVKRESGNLPMRRFDLSVLFAKNIPYSNQARRIPSR